MTRGIKIRLIAFLVLSAVGIVYVAGSYLGLVDRVLGRGLTVHATLPGSGGLFVGSEVTYRGVKVGKVSDMDVIPSGVRLDLALEEGTKIPLSSAIYVHNLSAVGEQYLDFEPPTRTGPYAAAGDTIAGDAESLPQSTDDLVTSLDTLVGSLDRNELSTAVSELGTMFRGTADPLSRMVDAGTQFVAEAKANQEQTIDLLRSGQTVLATQQDNASNIRTFARDLAAFTDGLQGSDADLRTVIQGGTPALDQVRSLLEGVEPTLPVFISNLVTVNQVVTARLPALEQTLVTFPRAPRVTATATSTCRWTTRCHRARTGTSRARTGFPAPTPPTGRSTRRSASRVRRSTSAGRSTLPRSERPPGRPTGSPRTMHAPVGWTRT